MRNRFLLIVYVFLVGLVAQIQEHTCGRAVRACGTPVWCPGAPGGGRRAVCFENPEGTFHAYIDRGARAAVYIGIIKL